MLSLGHCHIVSQKLVLWVLLLLCGHCEAKNPTTQPVSTLFAQRIQMQKIDTGHLHGISGLARDISGKTWGIAERNRYLVSIQPDSHEEAALISLHDIPKALDIEAITFLNDNALVVGTESQQDDRIEDSIYFMELNESGAHVVSTLNFDYRPFALTAHDNQGLEGLCNVEPFLIVASEMVGLDDGKRFAPLGIYDLNKKSWDYSKLILTSDGGKISDIACRRNGKDIELVAIERHYYISRLVHYQISTQKQPPMTVVVANDTLDLAPHFKKSIPNFEGILFVDKNSVWLISDNQHKVVSGPTQLAVIQLAH